MGSEIETKQVKGSITFDMHGKVDTVSRDPDRYLREITGMRKEEDLNLQATVIVEMPVLKQEEIQQAVNMAAQAAKQAVMVEEETAKAEAKTSAPVEAIKVEKAIAYKPGYPASTIMTKQPAPMEFKFSEANAIVTEAWSETITAPPTKIKAESRLIQHFSNQAGKVEPVFSSTVILDEKENEPAKRRPRSPVRESRQKEYDRKSILWRAKEAREKEKGSKPF